MFDLATALDRRSSDVLAAVPALERLQEIVDSPVDLSIGQWVQLYALVLDTQPDLIVELGRGFGNSTCVFTEAASHVPNARVVSIGIEGGRGWAVDTEPKLRASQPAEWFEPLEVRDEDILDVDFEELLSRGQRIVFFWDAHGEDVANHLLTQALPVLLGREHVVAIHDMNDTRYEPMDPAAKKFKRGIIQSPFEEVVPIADFIARNELPHETAAHSLVGARERDAAFWERLSKAYAEARASEALTDGHWMWLEVSPPSGTLAAPVAGRQRFLPWARR